MKQFRVSRCYDLASEISRVAVFCRTLLCFVWNRFDDTWKTGQKRYAASCVGKNVGTKEDPHEALMLQFAPGSKKRKHQDDADIYDLIWDPAMSLNPLGGVHTDGEEVRLVRPVPIITLVCIGCRSCCKCNYFNLTSQSEDPLARHASQMVLH